MCRTRAVETRQLERVDGRAARPPVVVLAAGAAPRVGRMGRYPHALSETARQCEPSILASYLLDLAGGLHSGYRALRVKDEEPAKANARLLLFTIVKRVLKNGLGLLGIPALERM